MFGETDSGSVKFNLILILVWDSSLSSHVKLTDSGF
jgi:hypothetical protein